MRRLPIIACLGALALLAACGGGKTFTGINYNGGGGSSGGGLTVLSMGSGSGATFQSGVIAISTKSLSAGGSTSLQVAIVTQTGAAYTQATTVTFSSPCVGQGLATITATGQPAGTASVTTSTGTATATYVASGCSGADVITASASANSQNLTATGTVTVAQASIGSIKFVSATPSNITLKGVGSVGGSETSTVVFKVLDTSGGARAGATVNFSLSTNVGGLSIAPASATTDANGQVQTIVSAGTVATTVSVIASTMTNSVPPTTISTQSNALSVSTGIPTSANISLAVKCQNVEAWEIDGVAVPITVSMTDRFSNPVPDGTAANFQTTLGGIGARCLTGNTAPGSGSCQVTWVSKAPYSVAGNPQSTTGNASVNAAYCPGPAFLPANTLCNTTTNGRSPILVTAIGEESFVSADGSGFFDTKDLVPFNATDLDNDFPAAGTPAPWSNGAGKPWFDTSEPFLNEWELFDVYGTPQYVLGEPFDDFNNNGLRDGPDGMVESALCQGAVCNAASASVAISSSNVIILSGSHANFIPVPSATATSIGSGLSFTVIVADDRNQQMPAQTTVAASVQSTTASIVGPSSYIWPCATAVGGQSFTFNLSPATPSVTNGPLIITVTTPGGGVTTAFYPLKP